MGLGTKNRLWWKYARPNQDSNPGTDGLDERANHYINPQVIYSKISFQFHESFDKSSN